MPLPSLVLSADVRALADYLLAAPVGSTVSLNALSKAIGSDVRLRRYLISKAIAVASREGGALFSTIRGVGYQRVPAEDAYLVGAGARKRVRGISRRAAGTITRAVSAANDLTDEARKKAFTEISSLQLLQHLSTDRSAKSVPPTDKPLPVAATMRAMASRIGLAVDDEAA